MADQSTNPENNSPLAKWKYWIILLCTVLVIVSGFFGVFASFVMNRLSVFEMIFTLAPNGTLMPEMNVLILGIDGNGRGGRSDTTIVVHVNKDGKSIGLVSIPRDTMVVIPGRKLDKINHAYAFGGPELACETTSAFLNIPIRYYVKITTESLIKLIDSIGGIEIDVSKKMYYTDKVQGLYIDLKPGMQHLNGRQVVGYMRFRHDNEGDFGRMKRQQQFLEEVGKQIIRSRNPVQTYMIINDFMANVETNLTASQISSLGTVVRQCYETNSIFLAQITGDSARINGVYYMQPNADVVKQVTEEYLKDKE